MLGVRVAFGIPGVLMVVATVVFWMGRNVFVHVPPSPGGKLGLLDAGELDRVLPRDRAPVLHRETSPGR